MNKEKEIFFNRADVENESAKQINCDCVFERCFEDVAFALKDKDHEFSLGITSILKCLRLAEVFYAIPELPDKWWLQVNSRYDIFDSKDVK